MRSIFRALGIGVVALLLAAPVLAQNPTGQITGTVTDADGAALPGATVTATSPNLQGSRVTTSGGNGTYKLAFLPPGDYTVTYELDGFGTSTREARVSPALSMVLDVTLQLATVSEEIVVTGTGGTISETTTGASSYTQKEIGALPIARDVSSVVQLAPGTHATGPGQGVTISGAMSFDNLWTLNGVVINENVRGQELPLFIEDAIQETTTQVSGISAEYGRFAGGVINAISKSGGNELSGSFRDSLTNQDWVADNEGDLAPNRPDDINSTYEATLGGYLWKDHVWFFGAGRDRNLSTSSTLSQTNLSVTSDNSQTRLEGKLTGTIADSHTLIGSYLDIDQKTTNTFFSGNIDDDGLTDREDPQTIESINYTGILTPSFFVEAQWSQREFQISKGGGARSRTLLDGTLMRTRQGSFRYYTPTFCGVCEQEERNNEDILAKGSYFLTTGSMGTHDLVFGADQFTDERFSVNHQTGSDFTVWDSNFTIQNQVDIFPTFEPAGNAAALPPTWIGWWAVFNPERVQPTNFETTSFYVNDRWQLDENWSFNLGARYDTTDGTNGGGAKVLNDEKFSPRLGGAWDVKGNGDLVITANVGTYVAGIANTRADATSTGGAIGLFLSEYGGPPVNENCGSGGPCLPTHDALGILFDWYLSHGGTTDINGDLTHIPNLFSVSIPGETNIIRGTLHSPAANEITLGATKRIGNRGLFRADLVYRDFEDFYSNKLDLSTGQVDTATGRSDLTLTGNFGDDVLERTYKGLHMQGRYRFSDRLSLNGNWTISELTGNIDGETTTSGPVPESPHVYPEYAQNSWNFPTGNLLADQRHKARVWAIWDLLQSEHHNLSLSVLESYFSGQAYSLSGAINTTRYVTNPGYETPPSTVTYFFSDRGEFTFDDITSTDLSLNYSFLWNAFGRQIEMFLEPEVLNLFNEDGLANPGFIDTRIRTADSANAVNACPQSPLANKACVPFNPFTETPVEGVNWAKRSTFGDPLSNQAFQTSRTYRFSVGFRF